MTKPRITFAIDAPAKVNLNLAVQYPPVDGYHLLDSVFQELALHDTLVFSVLDIDEVDTSRSCACTEAGTLVCLDCGPIDIPVEDNLIFKAVDASERALGAAVVDEAEALSITVEKRIPAGGGLGGGSSDAAAAIKACAWLAGAADAPSAAQVTAGQLAEPLHAAARSLGADVAFFLHGGAALMDGRGDTLVRILPSFPLPIVLMGEHEGISTGRIYRDFDAAPPPAPDARALAQAMEAFPALGTSEQKRSLALLCGNNLEPAAFEALPRLRERVELAKQDPDALNALVTGSGATSYAICADEGAAMRFANRAQAYCDWTCIC